ncbi:hypothetical protein RHS03_04450, partial [Rhizoctonia solani]
MTRTKPGPRATPKSLSHLRRGNSSGLSQTGTIFQLASPVSRDFIASHFDSSEICEVETYPLSDPTAPTNIVNTTFNPSITPATPQLHSGLSSMETPCTSLDAELTVVALQICGMVPTTPDLTLQVSTTNNLKDDEDYDDDPEGVRNLLCLAPTLDKNVRDNSLPFVLQCCAFPSSPCVNQKLMLSADSGWAIARVFDPLKLVDAMRDQVIQYFSSEDTRIRTILIANVMNKFSKSLTIDGIERSILDKLALTVRRNDIHFTATLPSDPALDRENAMRILDSMLEIFSLRTVTQSMATCFQSLDDAAPIFRRACIEPLGQPIDLSSILLNPNLNLRHFVTTDIVTTVTAGIPTYFQYKVSFSLELCEQMYRMQDKVGLQWLHGFPDQFIMLIAWINSLRETPGASEDTKLIEWIEKAIQQIRFATSRPSDPLLRIGRALCKANACDPRVVYAQKGFMRLVRGVVPARTPDAFLFTPIVVAGFATIEESDRNLIRQRILGVRECAEPGTVGNDFMLMLEDVWTRTRDEGRVAVWSDSRLATFRVTGR